MKEYLFPVDIHSEAEATVQETVSKYPSEVLGFAEWVVSHLIRSTPKRRPANQLLTGNYHDHHRTNDHGRNKRHASSNKCSPRASVSHHAVQKCFLAIRKTCTAVHNEMIRISDK
ncbi:hypothetical protein T07_13597 [Trichinella nelsoni]|uniref:Uncharacterized protein n=1 Tax=Trichinella nelsoni TaxID=6336 RepID=A0A0V0S573_9BILA|nr:hypothetical protein T07_13597 [Trichinella nelsoni]